MPDLTIEYMQMCSDLNSIHVGEIGGYEQTIDRGFGIVHCTCPAFKFRKNRDSVCKHLKELDSTICNYHELTDGPPEVDGVCPKCGKPTIYVRVGV